MFWMESKHGDNDPGKAHWVLGNHLQQVNILGSSSVELCYHSQSRMNSQSEPIDSVIPGSLHEGAQSSLSQFANVISGSVRVF